MSRIAVGVDAGGSKTAVCYSVDGVRKGVWYGGSANASAHGPERSSRTIAETIELALEGARPNAIFVGAAGAGREAVAEVMRSALESRFPQSHIAVRDDAYIALRAAIPEGDGVVLIAGTGAIAYAEKDGRGYRTGGYGYLFGEGGSGFAIGAAAIERLLRSYDGRAPRDAFVEGVESALGAASLQDTLQTIYGQPHPAAAVAELAPMVLEAAARGERTAATIVQRAATELAELTKAAIALSGLQGSAAPIALCGGLLGESTLLSYLLETRLINDFPEMPVRKGNPEPYAGALCAAEQMI